MNKRNQPPLMPFLLAAPEAVPPRPDMAHILVRVGFCIVVLLLLAQSRLLVLADSLDPTTARGPASAVTVTVTEGDVPLVEEESLPPGMSHRIAGLIRRLLAPDIVTVVSMIALGGLALLVLELSSAALTLIMSTRSLARTPRTMLDIHLPSPRLRKKPSDPAELWKALHAQLPTGADQGWVSMTLSAHPNQPVDLGIVIAGANEQERNSLVATIRRTLCGIEPDIRVRPASRDPLQEAMQPGRVVGWSEFVLRYPSWYPIRSVEEASSGSLIGVPLAALQPIGGICYQELHLSVRARHDRLGTGSWRDWLQRRILAQRAQKLVPDATGKILERKYQATAVYDVTVRAVVVGTDAAKTRTVRRAQREIAASLGQYQHRSGNRTQRWRLARSGQILVRAETAPSAAIRLQRLSLGSAGVALLAIALLALAIPAPLMISLLTLAAMVPIVGWAWQDGTTTAQRLGRLLTRSPMLSPPMPMLAPVSVWSAPAILSEYEVAGLWCLPDPSVDRLVNWLMCQHFPVKAHAIVPSDAKEWVTLGYSEREDGTPEPTGLTLRDMRRIVHIVAGVGVGKSRVLSNVAQQLFETGFCLIDGKGDDANGSLAAIVRRLIPHAEEHRLMVVDLCNVAWPVGLNPLAGIDPSQPGQIDEGLKRVLGLFVRNEAGGLNQAPGMRQYIDMSTLLVIECQPEPNMMHLGRALVDEAYRAALLPRCTNPQVRQFWEVVYPKTGEQQKTSRDAVLRRLDNLLANQMTRALLTQTENTIDFLRCIEERKILIIPLPHRALGELTGAIAAVIMQLLMDAVYRRPGSDQTRATYPVLIDELQVIVEHGATQDVRAMVTQVRGFGIGLVLAHQSLTQLGELRDEVLQSASSRIIFRCDSSEAEVFARQYASVGLTAMDVAAQNPEEHQYVALLSQGRPTGPMSVRPMPWPQSLHETFPPPPRSDWWNVLPTVPESADDLILELIYGERDRLAQQHLAEQLARWPDERWQYLLQRWKTIRTAQRSFILAHPGCIEVNIERQDVLSWLSICTPIIVIMAQDQRSRWSLDPTAIAYDVDAVTQPKPIKRAAALPAQWMPPERSIFPGLHSRTTDTAGANVGGPQQDLAVIRQGLADQKATMDPQAYQDVPDRRLRLIEAVRTEPAATIDPELQALRAELSQCDERLRDRSTAALTIATTLVRRDQITTRLRDMGETDIADLDGTIVGSSRTLRVYRQIGRNMAPDMVPILHDLPLANHQSDLLALVRQDHPTQAAIIAAICAEPTLTVRAARELLGSSQPTALVEASESTAMPPPTAEQCLSTQEGTSDAPTELDHA